MSAQRHVPSRPRILFVDDEPRVLNSMRIMFRRQYDTYFADNGPAALSIVKAHDIDVIVCDHRMPHMTGVEVLAQAKSISPRSVRILLTGYADLNAVEGSINDSEVFRFLTKPCAPDELRRTIELASSLALDSEASADVVAEMFGAEETQLEAAALAAAPPAAHLPVAAEPSGIEVIMEGDQAVESETYADTQPMLRPTATENEPTSSGKEATPAIHETSNELDTGQKSATAHDGMAILVFSNDDATYEAAVTATRSRVPVYRASNIVQVVRLLDEKRPGVLLTDISEDRTTIQNMTAKLKEHLPQLVTIAVSEHRDVLDMVWLINHGQIFRFLRKPLSAGRCALSLRAALEHHRSLLENPALIRRYQVEVTERDSDATGLMAKLGFLKKLWSGG